MRTLMLIALLILAPGFGTAEIVGNLNPNGDSYLSLRAGPSSKTQELSRMTAGTGLVILGVQGDWRFVRTDDGREGWAHSNYIIAGQPAAPSVSAAPSARVLAPVSDASPTVAPSLLAPLAEPATSGDAYDWVAGHVTQFHDPLAYYP